MAIGMTICAVLAACAAPAHTAQDAAATPSDSRTGPVVHLEDVYRFYEIYEVAGGNPSAEQLQREYLDAGSAGLHRFYVIAHEYIHVQQSPELADDKHPTVLEVSLVEGAAEFVAELIAGDVSYSHLRALTAGREMEIETAFVADKDKTDLSDWLYNATLD